MGTSPVSNVFPSEMKVSGAGSLSEEKVAKAGRKVSGAGDVPDEKTSKVVASEPREPRTKRLPVSTPFKGSVGLTKKFKGKLPDQRISSFLGEGKYWEIVPGRGRRD